MYDEIFGEVIFDYGYMAKKEITFFGETQEIEILIGAKENEEIAQIQRDAYEELMDNWSEMQHKIAKAILQYYNEEEKGAYGPDEEDEDEYAEWWPDIDSEEELVVKIHLDAIRIKKEHLMNRRGKNPIYVLFDRDWGGEDYDDNGVAVFIEDGEVSRVGYKDIAF